MKRREKAKNAWLHKIKEKCWWKEEMRGRSGEVTAGGHRMQSGGIRKGGA